MDMGDIVAGAWGIFRRAPPRWFALALVAAIVIFALQWVTGDRLDLSAEPGEAEVRDAAPWVGMLLGGSTIANLFAHVALVAATVMVLSGETLAVGRGYGVAFRKFLPVLLASIVTGLVAGGLSLTIVLIPLAVFFFVNWSMAAQVIVVEGESPLRALSRSRKIVKGQWWRTFGINLAILLLAFLPSFVLGRVTAPFGLDWVAALGSALASLLAAPFVAIAQTLLYQDLRRRKGEKPFVPALKEAV